MDKKSRNSGFKMLSIVAALALAFMALGYSAPAHPTHFRGGNMFSSPASVEAGTAVRLTVMSRWDPERPEDFPFGRVQFEVRDAKTFERVGEIETTSLKLVQ